MSIVKEYNNKDDKEEKNINKEEKDKEQKDKEENKKIYGYNKDTGDWHCLECGENMGQNNSRQLCGKYRCYNV